MRSMNTVLLLDVDGVIFPRDKTSVSEPVVCSFFLKSLNGNWSSVIAPETIKLLELLNEQNSVEVKWLSTWSSETVLLNEEFGLNFEFIAETPDPKIHRKIDDWWKTREVKKLLASGHKVIWIDDSIDESVNERFWASEDADEFSLNEFMLQSGVWARQNGVKVIAPDGRFGLRSKERGEILGILASL